jgi:serine/threonine protein kinase
LNYAF